jgi:hypothetical protein
MNTSANPDLETEPATDTEPNSETSPESPPEIRILKTASCPSLSRKSTLTFNIGCNTVGEIQFQITSNDGGGFFNDDWVAQSSIAKLLDRQPKGAPITSATFRSIYPSKSTNSPGFLAAILLHCGLLQPSKVKPRCYELGSPDKFISEVNALLGTGGIEGRKALTLKGRPKKAAQPLV